MNIKVTLKECWYCHFGHMEDGITDIKANTEDGLVRVIGIPAQVCDSCGESTMSGKVLSVIERAKKPDAPHTTKTYKLFDYRLLEEL